MPGIYWDGRNISAVRLNSALELNRRLARHFSSIYEYPDWQELESIGLEVIARCCAGIKKSRRHKTFLSYCQVSIRRAIIRYVRTKNRQSRVMSKMNNRLERLSREPDYYQEEEKEEGI